MFIWLYRKKECFKFDNSSRKWIKIQSMLAERHRFPMMELNNGRIMITGDI